MFYHVSACKLNSEDLEFICESASDVDFIFSDAFCELFARFIKDGYVLAFKEMSL